MYNKLYYKITIAFENSFINCILNIILIFYDPFNLQFHILRQGCV